MQNVGVKHFWNIMYIYIVGFVCIFLSTYSVHVIRCRWSAVGCGASDAAYYTHLGCMTFPLAVCEICRAVSLPLFHHLILTVIKFSCSLHRPMRVITT